MNSEGVVWEEEYIEDALFPNPYYATGFPVTEAYWSEVMVAGIPQDVLWQCFQRRCLTYTPGNIAGWQVEVGNVGLHYYDWRYDDAPATPTATSTTPEPTATATTAPTATSTPVPTTDQLYTAFLSGDEEVADVETEATGAAWFHVSADGASVRFQVTVADIENITAAHIHLGDPGDTGPVVLTLFDGGGAAVTPPHQLVEGTFDADGLEGPLEDQPLAALLNALAAGDAYVNIHTSQYPNGEIRGQIAVGAELLLRADLSGENEADPVDTDASGVALLYYDAAAGTLEYQLRVIDLQEATAAHIHLGDPGQNGPVVAPLFSSDTAPPAIDGVLAEGAVRSTDLQGDLTGASARAAGLRTGDRPCLHQRPLRRPSWRGTARPGRALEWRRRHDRLRGRPCRRQRNRPGADRCRRRGALSLGRRAATCPTNSLSLRPTTRQRPTFISPLPVKTATSS